MASTISTFSSALKTRYTDEKVEDLTMRDRPTMAMIPKDEEGGGENEKVPLIYNNPQGVSSSLANANTYSTNIGAKHFLLTYGDLSGSVKVGLKVMRASRNNPGAFLQNKTAEIDGLYETVADALDLALWSNGGLSLGQGASYAGEVLTLANAQDAYNFHVGMNCEASATDGTNGAGSLLATQSDVTAVDRASGTVTFTSIAAVIATTGTAYIFRKGTFATDGVSKVMAGIPAFIYATESPPTLYSMVRTADPTKLAGCRVTSAAVAGLGIEARLRKLGTWMSGRYGARGFDWGVLHPEDWEDLAAGLASKGTRPLQESETRFNFSKIEMACGGRNIPFFSDPRCPKGTGFVLRKDTWRLKSMGKLIAPDQTETGLVLVPAQGSTDYEYRLLCFPSAVCRGPLHNGRVPLT